VSRGRPEQPAIINTRSRVIHRSRDGGLMPSCVHYDPSTEENWSFLTWENLVAGRLCRDCKDGLWEREPRAAA
jgi:hypothetical protein